MKIQQEKVRKEYNERMDAKKHELEERMAKEQEKIDKALKSWDSKSETLKREHINK